MWFDIFIISLILITFLFVYSLFGIMIWILLKEYVFNNRIFKIAKQYLKYREKGGERDVEFEKLFDSYLVKRGDDKFFNKS